jgi:hypothetical protein
MAYSYSAPTRETHEWQFPFPLGSGEELKTPEAEAYKPTPLDAATQALSSWRLHAGTSSEVISKEDTLKRLESLYLPRDSARVREFISRNAGLAGLLLEAYRQIEVYFGTNPPVALEVVSDPEAEDFEELFAYIITSLEPGEALARLEELDESWFLDQLDRAGGKFNLNLEFA